jgi:hypothetical protein
MANVPPAVVIYLRAGEYQITMENLVEIEQTSGTKIARTTPMTKHLLAVIMISLPALLAGCSGTPVAGDNSEFSNKWRIEVSEGAKSTGNMIFRITPKGGRAIDVDVGITEGARENKVASTIRDAMRVQLPDDDYKVEKDDGEDVLVKARGDAERFSVVLISNNVKSVRIRLDKE